MNIFYLSKNAKTCARLHVDKHCVKMILEYAQLLSTAHRVLDGTKTVIISSRKQTKYVLDSSLNQILYSATHINHPSAIWVRKSVNNYKWLHKLLSYLCKEYTYRYEKIHKVEHSGLLAALKNTPNNIPNDEFTEPTPAMPDQYKVENDSIESYKRYYIGSKSKLFSWKKRGVPLFISTSFR